MTPSSILKGTAVLLLLQGVSTIVLNLCGFKFPPALLAMLLLLALMLKGIIRPRTVEDVCDIPRTVEDVCDILIEKMGMLFLPAGVSILLYLDIIVAESTAIIATVLISSLLILVVTALFLNFMLKGKGGEGK